MLATALLTPLFALEGEWADIRAVIVVVISFVMLIGTIYMLLASNYGAYVGYLVTMVSLMGWMILFSIIWLVGVPGTLPGTGPRTQEPRWIPFTAESEFGKDYADALATFPDRWDAVTESKTFQYPGNIDAIGEVEKVRGSIAAALAARAHEQEKLPDDDPKVKQESYDFRLPESEAITPEDEKIPVADARFLQDDKALLFGVRIPATEQHPELVVFAARNKGAVYRTSLTFLVVSILAFAVHLLLLARHEKVERAREAELAGAPA